MTCNNQQSFHLLTIFDHHVTSAHPCCFRDLFMRGVCYKMQEGWTTSRCPSRIAGIEIFAQGGNFHKKNRQCDKCLLPWCICVVWGCCAMKIGWLRWVWAMKKWWIHHCCGDVCGCRPFFTMPVDVLFRDILMYPYDTKNRPMSCHNLRLSPWHNIGRICIGFKLEKHIWIQTGGVYQLQCSFFLFGTSHTMAVRQWMHHRRK